MTSLLLLTSLLSLLPCECAVRDDLVVLSLSAADVDPSFLDVPAAVGVPRVLDVAACRCGDVAVSNVPVVFDADDPAVGDVLSAASSSEVPAVAGFPGDAAFLLLMLLSVMFLCHCCCRPYYC